MHKRRLMLWHLPKGLAKSHEVVERNAQHLHYKIG